MDSDNENRKDETGDTTRNNLIAKCVMKSITHPLDYARFLVQVSYNQVLKTYFNDNFLVKQLFNTLLWTSQFFFTQFLIHFLSTDISSRDYSVNNIILFALVL